MDESGFAVFENPWPRAHSRAVAKVASLLNRLSRHNLGMAVCQRAEEISILSFQCDPKLRIADRLHGVNISHQRGVGESRLALTDVAECDVLRCQNASVDGFQVLPSNSFAKPEHE